MQPKNRRASCGKRVGESALADIAEKVSGNSFSAEVLHAVTPAQMIRNPLQARYLLLFAYCFATVSALVFQKFLLPMIPSMHAGSGLLMHDAVYFHDSAMLLADDIREHGWSAWSAWSIKTMTAGNVAVLAALYAAFSSSDPALIIPVNAFFHAVGATLVMLIGRELWPGRTGVIAGLLAGVLFTIFPSALSWYSQPLKDGYAIAGILLVLYSWLRALNPRSVRGGVSTLIMWMAAGILLLMFVKPYYLKLLVVPAGVTACIAVVHALQTRHPQRRQIVSFYLLMIVSIGVLLAVFKPIAAQGGTQYAQWSASQKKSGNWTWTWEKSSWLPGSLDGYLEIAAETRAGLIQYNQKVGAGSLIDADAAPRSAMEIAFYLPRALQVGVFSPFPDTWLQKPSITRLVAVAETSLWYLIAPGLLLALYYRRSLELFITLIFAAYFLTVLSFVTPNIGTLYRYRYAFEFLLIVSALGGWVQFFLNRGNGRAGQKSEPATDPAVAPAGNVMNHRDEKKRLFGGAAAVSLITLIGSLGFFVRDLLMTRWFGAGNEMDIFSLGAMIPMFLVSVLSMPAGIAIIPVYSALRMNEPAVSNKLISAAISALTLFLATVFVVLYFFLPYLFSTLGWHYAPEKLAAIRNVTDVYLVIMLLSGFIIIANAVLNAEKRSIFPAMAQIAVPIIVIAALAIFGRRYGIYAAVYGMLAGQLLNLVVVAYPLRGRGLLSSLRPDAAFMRKFLPFRQYSLLAAVAVSAALIVPTANAIAARLPAGSVAIISFGTKVILLITGVVGIGMNTVLLPYFSNLVARLHHRQAQSDLSFFLVIVTLLSAPVALVLTLLTEPMLKLVFSNSALTADNVQALTRVIQYGVIQLPFFTCSLVAIKYMNAYQRSGIILLSSIVGFALTVVLGVFFAKHLGVGGISLAISLSMAVSASIIIFYANFLRHLPISDSIFIVFNWVIFITLFICLHFGLYVGEAISLIAYLLLVAGHWKAAIVEWQSA